MTDHLQLLLRKSGHHLHTTAEREVVRMISTHCSRVSVGLLANRVVSSEEKTCYVALSPAKEEKEAQGGGRMEEYKLPDGKIIRVSPRLVLI